MHVLLVVAPRTLLLLDVPGLRLQPLPLHQQHRLQPRRPDEPQRQFQEDE